MFNVVGREPALEDTLILDLVVDTDDEANISLDRRKLGQYLAERATSRAIYDEQFAASMRARLRLGREPRIPDPKDGEDAVIDEEYEALIREELAGVTSKFTVDQLKEKRDLDDADLPNRLAACAVDWDGVRYDGKPVPFSHDMCEKMMNQGDLARDILAAATDKLWEEQAAEEVVEGNSEPSSDGESSD